MVALADQKNSQGADDDEDCLSGLGRSNSGDRISSPLSPPPCIIAGMRKKTSRVTYFRFRKCVEQSKGYRWPLLAHFLLNDTITMNDTITFNQTFLLYSIFNIQFLDASSHLYTRVCPSVVPSVRWSVGPSVCHAFVKNVWEFYVQKWSRRHT